MAELPAGRYEVFADDDDVIGLTVAKTYPHGYTIVRTDPPIMDAFDEYEVAAFIAESLTTGRPSLADYERDGTRVERDPVRELFAKTANVHTTVCGKCGGSGTQEV